MTDDRPIGVLVMAYRIADGPDDIERYYTDIRGGRAPSPVSGPRVPVCSGRSSRRTEPHPDGDPGDVNPESADRHGVDPVADVSAVGAGSRSASAGFGVVSSGGWSAVVAQTASDGGDSPSASVANTR
jgi:hypothetical protein